MRATTKLRERLRSDQTTVGFPAMSIHWFLVVLAIAIASSALASEPGPRRGPTASRVPSPPGGDECLGVPECVTQRSTVEVLGPGQQREISVACGRKEPHAWHWEPLQDGHIQSSLQERTASRVTVLATNVAAIDGAVQVVVGCSAEPYDAVRAAARRPLSAKARYRQLLGWPGPGQTVCDAWSIPGESSPAVPQCTPVTHPPTPFGTWASHVTSYPCPADHPYYAHPHYTWDDSCFSCVDWTGDGAPTALRLQCTNWCRARDIVVTSACSKIPFNTCPGQITLTSDPGCPVSNQHTNCKGVPPVCFITWNEQCTQGTYAGYSFSCTADQGFEFCYGCKGQ